MDDQQLLLRHLDNAQEEGRKTNDAILSLSTGALALSITFRSSLSKDIFREFASVAGLKLCPDQIETPAPPQPDVLAMIEGTGLVAYELGEIVDQDLARKYNLDAETFVAIREHHENMPPEQRIAFDLKFSAAHLTFRFSEQATLRRRCGALPAAFEELCSVAVPANGRLQMDSASLSGVLEFVRIVLTSPGTGPIFEASRPSFFNPSALTILKKKLAKSYETANPVELILHSDRRCLYAEDSWLPEVSAHVEEHLAGSAFRRIWVFERYPPRIVLSIPSQPPTDQKVR